MLHIWWEGPWIRSCLSQVFSIICEITDIVVEQQPSIALLNGLPEGVLRLMKQLIFFMLLAARITIAEVWK